VSSLDVFYLPEGIEKNYDPLVPLIRIVSPGRDSNWALLKIKSESLLLEESQCSVFYSHGHC
jgi:hypothetical protein